MYAYYRRVQRVLKVEVQICIVGFDEAVLPESLSIKMSLFGKLNDIRDFEFQHLNTGQNARYIAGEGREVFPQPVICPKKR